MDINRRSLLGAITAVIGTAAVGGVAVAQPDVLQQAVVDVPDGWRRLGEHASSPLLQWMTITPAQARRALAHDGGLVDLVFPGAFAHVKLVQMAAKNPDGKNMPFVTSVSSTAVQVSLKAVDRYWLIALGFAP